jgi:hypothetical protein
MNILKWMEQNVQNPRSDWEELVATLTVMDQVIGFSYLNLRKSDGWIWGGYFGLLKAWRHFGWAGRFWEFLSAEIESRLPNAEGILFEIEPISEVTIRETIDAIASGAQLTESQRTNARNLQRAYVYETQNAKAIVSRSGAPVFYKQPHMHKSGQFSGVVDREREVELTLMTYPLKKKSDYITHDNQLPPKQAIKFAYDMYRRYYGTHPVYIEYLDALLKEILEKLPDDACWGSLVSEEGNCLCHLLRRHKIEIPF